MSFLNFRSEFDSRRDYKAKARQHICAAALSLFSAGCASAYFSSRMLTMPRYFLSTTTTRLGCML